MENLAVPRPLDGRIVNDIEVMQSVCEEKHSWNRAPTCDGDKRQWRRYKRDVERFLETEQLDVDCRLARGCSRGSGAAKFAETIEVQDIKRSTGFVEETETNDHWGKALHEISETCDGNGRRHKKDQVQEYFFYNKKSKRRSGQSMAQWINVFEKAVFGMNRDRLTVCSSSTWLARPSNDKKGWSVQ